MNRVVAGSTAAGVLAGRRTPFEEKENPFPDCHEHRRRQHRIHNKPLWNHQEGQALKWFGAAAVFARPASRTMPCTVVTGSPAVSRPPSTSNHCSPSTRGPELASRTPRQGTREAGDHHQRGVVRTIAGAGLRMEEGPPPSDRAFVACFRGRSPLRHWRRVTSERPNTAATTSPPALIAEGSPRLRRRSPHRG